MKISYFIISDSFDENPAYTHLGLNEQLNQLFRLLEGLSEDESVLYSIDLFDRLIYRGKSLMEWLYSDGEMRDEKRLFQILLRKMQETENEFIQHQINNLQVLDYDLPAALITFYNWTVPMVEQSLIVQKEEDCLIARRFYMKFIQGSSDFLEECHSCFPQLFLNSRVQQTLKRFKPFRDYVNELILHLATLNDHGRRLFLEYQEQNELVVLRHLGQTGGIHCSGQGDAAYEKANLSFDFPSDQGGSIKIVCAPHTKLFNNHSSERIYFNWGHQDVEKGEKLLIGHIGEHL